MGQLGHGPGNAMCAIPKLVDYFKDKTVIYIAAGYTHTLCVTSNREVYGWGLGPALGVESDGSIASHPSIIPSLSDKGISRVGGISGVF